MSAGDKFCQLHGWAWCSCTPAMYSQSLDTQRVMSELLTEVTALRAEVERLRHLGMQETSDKLGAEERAETAEAEVARLRKVADAAREMLWWFDLAAPTHFHGHDSITGLRAALAGLGEQKGDNDEVR